MCVGVSSHRHDQALPMPLEMDDWGLITWKSLVEWDALDRRVDWLHLWKLLIRGPTHQTSWYISLPDCRGSKLQMDYHPSYPPFPPYKAPRPPHQRHMVFPPQRCCSPSLVHVKEQFGFWSTVSLFFPLFSGHLHHSLSNTWLTTCQLMVFRKPVPLHLCFASFQLHKLH